MKGKFFTVTAKPDIINGDISNVSAGNGAGVDIVAGDIIFDWTPVNVPGNGSCILKSVTAWVNGELGGNASGTDWELLIGIDATSHDGKVVAPPTLGAVGTPLHGGGSTNVSGLRNHLVGHIYFDAVAATTAYTTSVGYGNFYTSVGSYDAVTKSLFSWSPIALDLPKAPTEGYSRLYVAGLQVADRHYNPGVLSSATYDADDPSTGNSTDIAVDTVDARHMFSVGDTVYVHTSDTKIPGTVASIETNGTKIVMTERNGTVDIGNNDVIYNANPIKINLGFEV